MVQTSFGLSGRFWSISRPLLQGARRQGEMEFSVVIVVSDAGSSRHSAGSPSTGRDNLPRKDAIARSGEQCGGRKNRDDPGRYDMRIRRDAPCGTEMPMPITGAQDRPY
jgi:hypothetical protein